MTQAFYILTFILFSLIACDQDNSAIEPDYSNEEFTVIVTNPNDFTTCGLPQIKFIDKLELIAKITNSNSTVYNAYNLDEQFAIKDQKLKIKARATLPEELLPCKAWGVWFPWVTILDTKVLN